MKENEKKYAEPMASVEIKSFAGHVDAIKIDPDKLHKIPVQSIGKIEFDFTARRIYNC